MELIWATDDYRLLGITYAGFPILVDKEMRSVAPANSFLRHHLLRRGRVASAKSWKTLAQNLYDYFGFLEANGFKWDGSCPESETGLVSAYRDYCVGECNLSARTINQRLSTVTLFYRFALTRGWIRALPFSFESVHLPRNRTGLSHLDTNGGQVLSTDVMLKVPKKAIPYLSRDEIRSLLAAIRNPTHKMMVRMGLQVGLRREEIATFPIRYVFNPNALHCKKAIRVRLDPTDGSGMRTKASKPRDVLISSDFMCQLWRYAVHERPRLLHQTSPDPEALFLTAKGEPWANDGKGFLRVLRNSAKKLEIDVTPHLLRHTYATYTLAALQNQRTSSIDPLVFLQKQLGHSSITTTMIYAHLVDELVDVAVTAYDSEVSEWSRDSNVP